MTATATKRQTRWQAFTRQVLEALDLRAEATELGLKLLGEPSENGWIKCHAIDREDKTPSAGFNVSANRPARGCYKDLGGGLKLSFFDLAARRKGLSDWQAARDYYAQRLGIAPPRGGKPGLAEQVELQPDNEMLCLLWTRRKPGLVPQSVAEAGGRLCRWKAHTCLVFWAYGADSSEPVAGILYQVTGQPFPATRHLGQRKTHLLRGSRDGLIIVGGPERLARSTVVWKCEGLTDALSLAPHLPEGHVAVTNACGAGSFRPDLARLLRGKTVNVVHDADEPGQRGATAWTEGLLSEGVESKNVVLPYEISVKHGRDLRDWLNEGHTFPELEALAESAPSVPWTEAMPAKVSAERAQTHVIDVSPSTRVADVMAQITRRMLESGRYYVRADQLVVVGEQDLQPILRPCELAGQLNAETEFYFLGRGENPTGAYKPLPNEYGNVWLTCPREKRALSPLVLYSRNPVFGPDWHLLPPGYDRESGIYYAGQAIAPRDSTSRLDELLKEFCFKTDADRANYCAMLVTAVLAPQFMGSKPAVLFNGNQPGLGKSILAQVLAIIRDGRTVGTATYNPNDEEFEKRLGAIVHSGAMTIIIDNAKARSGARIDSACLERSITDPVLSFRLLKYSQEIRADNAHIFCITANSAHVSRDLVTRCVVVNLYHEGNPEARKFVHSDPEGFALEHREELLSEILGMVERWKLAGMPRTQAESRFNKRGWAQIVGGILEVQGIKGFLENAEEAATACDPSKAEFAELVGQMLVHPRGIWTATELVELAAKHSLLQEEIGHGTEKARSTCLGILAGRFVGERFPLGDGEFAVFHKTPSRKGAVYRAGVVDDSAGRCQTLLDVEHFQGSAA